MGGVLFFFFFQAEDGIRDLYVSGVQTCALPIFVDNALRHGNGTVTLSATEAGGMVSLQVGDEGAGFPRDFVASAFERFSRPDHSRASPGSGLGLSIVKTIVEAHGGTAHAGTSVAGGFE